MSARLCVRPNNLNSRNSLRRIVTGCCFFYSPVGNSCIMPSAAAKAMVQEAIKAHKVVVFSKTYCPYCVKAKRALGQFLKPTDFFVIELEQRSDCDDIQDALLEFTGGRSVPRVFVGGQFIGGGDDTARKASNGELQTLLKTVGVL